jgi:hypothetical protein
VTVQRVVTDILTIAGAPVAFDEIRHGQYRGICPWCALNLGVVESSTFGDLYEKLYDLTAEHMYVCEKKAATEIAVAAASRTHAVKLPRPN